ncbi:MAG: Response regulator of zinc sigma-54-dependent two-component system, partial [Myxococcaceae bacterium]|nr:Response regulator of zinc sigma-54-dependent two-component system [Myxococcaceae bacterium]
LEAEIEAGRFREDLFFRINVIAIDMPPLRLRGNDVLLLAQHFLGIHASKSGKQVATLSVAAADKLLAYLWPGNVRELQNCIERAVAFAEFEQLRVDDLPEKVRAYRPPALALDASEIVTLEENESSYIARVMAVVGGNKSLAARLLGIDRKSLWRRLGRLAGNPTDEG